MLPGSELYKIKEKNTQLQQCINLLNLHLNATKIKYGKRRATSEPMDCGEGYFNDIRGTSKKRIKTNLERGYTMDDLIIDDDKNLNFYDNKSLKSVDTTCTADFLSISKINLKNNNNNSNISNEVKKTTPLSELPTLIHNIFDSQEITQKDVEYYEEDKIKYVAFELNFISSHNIGSYLAQCKNFKPLIQVPWNDNGETEYVIKRIDFWYLPHDNPQKISREHCKIRAIRPITQQIYKEEVMTGPTLDCTDQDIEDSSISSQVIKYELYDLSTNGTYYKKKSDVANETEIVKVKFKQIPKHQSISIEDGDIVCLIVKRPGLQELTFGFEFKVRS